jgi:hypothetical protein
MFKNKMFSIVAIVSALGIAGLTTTAAFYQTAVADRGGNPDDSAKSTPACDNANERNDAFHDRQDTLANRGQDTAHEQVSHNFRGLDFSNC